MFNFFKRKRNKKGFTLVELLTVMFVVGAIAAVALPSYKRAVEKSRAAQGLATLESIAKAQMNHNVLRGTFSPTFNNLPLELRDSDSNLVTGSEFNDNYFQFTLSDTDSIAVAKRQNGEYELSVDYVTGRLYCSPATNSVCMRFGLEERDASVGQGGMGSSTTTPEISDGRVCEGGYCYDYKDGQQVSYCVADSNGKDCIKDGTYCDKDSQTCKSYKDGKLVKTCRSNADFSDCSEDDMEGVSLDEDGNPLDGLICSEKKCIYYQNGKEVGVCEAQRGEPTAKCYDEFGLSGVACEGSKCVTFENGKTVLTCDKEAQVCVNDKGEKCVINDLGNACKDKTEGKEGLVCNEKECIFYDKDGNPIGSCSAENDGQNKECYKAFNLSGKFCDKEKCYEFENGEEKASCSSANNGENKDCYEAFGLSGRICDDKMCYEFEKGKIQGQCSSENDGENPDCYKAFKLSGIICDKDKCYSFENGEQKAACSAANDGENPDCYKAFGKSGLVCDEEQCVTFDAGNPVFACNKQENMCFDSKTGEYCTANEDYTACKQEEIKTGFVCDEKGCTYYDEEGKPQGTCSAYENGKPKVECYDQFGLTGEVCDDNVKCFTYENGQVVSYCNLKKKACYDKNGECTPNENWTGCAKEEGGKAGFVCDDAGCTYYDEDGKAQGTCPSYGNGKPKIECYDKFGLSGEVCDDVGNCYTYENGTYVAVCDLKNKVCYDATNGKQCTPNENWTGCAKEGGTQTGLVCTEDGVCTYYDENGIPSTDSCGVFPNGKPSADCYEMFGLSGQACDGDDYCYNFVNGQPTFACSISKKECYNPVTGKRCPANSDFTGCGYDTGNVPNIKDGTACDENTGICYTFKNGELINQCTLGKDCDSITDGYLCGPKGCSVIRNGSEIMQCYKEKNMCYAKDGKECKPNATYTACEDGSVIGIPTGLVCDDAGCTYYDNNGYAQGTCTNELACYESFKLTGEACYKETCVTFEKGKKVAHCNKAEGMCYDDITGKECEPNDNFTGCAEGSGGQKGVVCDDAGCTYYNDKGVAQGTCKNEAECYKSFKLTGTACDGTEASKTSCATYNNGQVTSYCTKGSKTGSWVCYDKATGKVCEPNTNYTGCAEGSGSTTQNGLVCAGFTCTEYKDGVIVNICANNGKDECISGEGQETTCINGTCQIYNGGELAYTCTEGSSASGGCERNGFVCDKTTCADYTYGTANEGTTCYNNGNGGCIKGEGTETGYCDKKQCLIYQDGEYAYACKVGSSASGGCDRNGMVCDSADCYDYTYGHADKDSHCYNNGSGGCIKGEGTEMGYCESDGSSCKIYVNGKYSYSCKPKDSGAGGCDRNGIVCDEGKTECYGYEFGGLTGETCHSNGNGGCIKGEGDEMVCIAGKCNMYQEGQWVNSCVANTEGTGCASGAVQNGFICIDAECKEYKDGEVVSSCYNNGKDECISNEGEAYVCYDSGDCTYYVDGKKQYSCIKGYSGEGGCDLNGWRCPDKYCYEYKYGKKTGNTCYSNNASTGCITGKGVELGWCDGDLCRVFVEGTDSYSCQKGSDKEKGCERNGLVCDGISCAQYVFGLKQEGTTCFRNYEGKACITGKGNELGYCGNTDGSCNVFIEGKQQYSCVKGSNKVGGCDRNGLVCEDGKYCQEYLFGKELSSCSANYAGNACITGKGMEVGECSTDTPSQCTVFKEGKGQYSCIKGSNKAGGCDRNGFVCDGITCAEYVYGATQEGTTCFRTYSGGGCITGKGTELGYCGNTDGSCNVFVEGKQQYSCVKGSSSEGGCDRNGRVCSGFVCYDYVYGKTTGSGCYNNGNGGCITGKGTETVCIKGKCNVYQDGKIVTEGCTANDEETGCKEEGGDDKTYLKNEKGVCVEYVGDKKTGMSYKMNEDGNCIKYDNGKEVGIADPSDCKC